LTMVSGINGPELRTLPETYFHTLPPLYTPEYEITLNNNVRYLFDRYLAGAYTSMPGYSQTTQGRALIASAAQFYSTDHYALLNMAAPLLPGWQNAALSDKVFFSRTIHPMERSALLNSLFENEIELRRAGANALALAAQQMREFLAQDFNSTLAAVDTPQLQQLFAYASGPNRVRFGNREFTSDELALYNSLPESVRRLANAMGSDAFVQWRRLNPFRVTYEPAYGLEFIDRAIINAAEMLSPIMRTAQRITDQRTDIWGDLGAITSIMNGNYSVRLGPTELNYHPLAVIGDGVLTLLTIIPVGGSVSMARHIVITVAGGFSASVAMAAIDVSPINENWRGPLRFAAGLAAGVGGGTLGNAATTITRNRLPLLVSRTLDLARAVSRVAQQRALMQFVGHTAADVRQLAFLMRELRSVQSRVQQLRSLAAAQGLEAIETEYTNAMEQLARAEARAAAPGLSPSQRALYRNSEQMRTARTVANAAAGRLQTAYAAIDAAAATVRAPGSGGWGYPSDAVVREAEEVTRRLQLPGLGVEAGTESTIRVAAGDLAPIGESEIMALAEWHGREITASFVRLRSGAQRIIISFGEEGGGRVLSQSAVTLRYGDGAQLYSVIHTHQVEFSDPRMRIFGLHCQR
jgi:hypothetical protein